MNDMWFQIGWHVEDAGGLANVGPARFHHRLNRNPFNAVGYEYPVDMKKV